MRDGRPNTFEIIYMVALLIYAIVVHDIFIDENSSVENLTLRDTPYEQVKGH